MKISIMIEGALGLNWPRWQRIVRAAEDMGFEGLYRSDHFFGRESEREDALEAYTSLTWAAAETHRLKLGTLVSPISFRDPRILAWQASAIGDLSNGRFRLGVGTGWQEREHAAFGFNLGSVDERFARLEDGLKVIRALIDSEQPVSLDSDRYPLQDAWLKPLPPRLPITIGGNGPKRTLPLVARYADEWNALKGDDALVRERNSQLDELLAEAGRQPHEVRRSQMCGVIIAKDQSALDADTDAHRFTELLDRGEVVGTPNQIVEILGRKREAGIQEVQLQWLDLDDISGLELIASDVLPQMA